MKLAKWLGGQKAETRPQTTELDFLLPREKFYAALARERLRVDRTNSALALVVFRFPDGKSRCETMRPFASLLRQRLRATDVAGFFGPHSEGLAVLLWDSKKDGALRFLESLRALTTPHPLPPHKVFLYPTDPPYEDDPFRGPVNIPVRHRGEISQEQEDRQKENEQEAGEEIHALESLFLKPLPGWKRVLDILGASCGLIVLSPLLLLTAVLIKLTSRGPVFFKQQRDGLGGRPFTIYKFRTMYSDAEARKEELRKYSEQDGPAFKMTHDPRITPLGRYLRKTCIDELPQLWNVLKGDMTLVGPRPLDSREARKIQGWGRRRMEITPGLTCIWQVDGKSRVTFNEWMRMDIRYLKRRSLWHDLKLIVRTAISVLLHRASV